MYKPTFFTTVNGKKISEGEQNNLPNVNLTDPNKPLISGTITGNLEIHQERKGPVLVGDVESILASLAKVNNAKQSKQSTNSPKI